MSEDIKIKALKAAFPHTLPILAGFLFLGLSYGIYMSVKGFSFIYPAVMSLTIFAGSVEFIIVNFLLISFDPIAAFIVAFMVNARHLFYAISMLDKYRGHDWKSIYLIFGMCDESFAINYSTNVPEDIDEGWFYTWITFLNQMYWFCGATLGGILGNIINININGLEFVITALFVAIFIDQLLKEDNHTSSVLGIIFSVICIMIFGADNFIIPTMLCVILFFTLFKKQFEGVK